MGRLKNVFRCTITLAALGAVTGCASMSQDECRMADWYSVGFEDGVRGHGADYIGQHREACAEHGIAPDFQAYQSGRTAGLTEFCQPANGFHIGAGGSKYTGVCPSELEQDFLPAYQDGRHLHLLQSQVNAIDSKIRSNHLKIKNLKKRQSEKEDLVIADGTSKEERILLLKEIWQLAKEQGELGEEIHALEKTRTQREQDLERYRQEVAYLY